MGTKRSGKFEIVEPKNCTRMSKEEMVYDGGFLHWGVSLGVSLAGWGMRIIGKKTHNRALSKIGTGIMWVGIVSTGCGIFGGVRAATTTAFCGAKGMTQAANFAYNSTIGVLDGCAGLGYTYGNK